MHEAVYLVLEHLVALRKLDLALDIEDFDVTGRAFGDLHMTLLGGWETGRVRCGRILVQAEDGCNGLERSPVWLSNRC